MTTLPPDNLFDALVQDIEERAMKLGQAVLEGACKDYAEYRHSVGQLRGMNEGINAIQEMQRRYEEL